MQIAKITFFIVMLTLTFNIGCVISVLEQNQETETIEKPKETVITVVDTTDVKTPTVVGSINLPSQSDLNNNVVLLGKYGYVTTDKHLLVIDISDPNKPSYLTAIPFPNEIDKAHITEDKIVVSGNETIYLVDISIPHQPALLSKVSLHHPNAVREFDINGSYLYVMDVNNYLHIYHLTDSTITFVQTVTVQYPSDLVGIIAKDAEVEQVTLEHRTAIDHGWLKLSDRTNLLEFNCVHKRMRSTEDHLVFASRRYPYRDIMIVMGEAQNRPSMWKWIENYNIEANYIAHLYFTGKKTLPYGKPTSVYFGNMNKIQFISQDQWTETIAYEEYQLLGTVTDFQISKNLLFVANSKSFLSIINLDAPTAERFLSGTSLQAFYPTSIVVDENHVYVLSTEE